MKAIAHAEALRARVWPDAERVTSILTSDERLDSTFRPYLTGGLEPVPTWMIGYVVRLVGPGVAEVALERARDEDKALPQLGPYFDAIEAEVALTAGDEERAIAKARSAIAGLPKSETLLAARTAAVAAEAARKQGDDKTAMGFYLTVMQKDAGALRRLGLTIPASVRAEGSNATVQHAADLVAKSPRLRKDDRGFKVLVSLASPTTLRACLIGPDGAQLSCATAEQPPKEEPKKPAPPNADPRQVPSDQPKEDEGPKETWEQLLARAFHHDVFAITVGLSATDLNSLDGSTTVASQAQRDQMTGILKGMATDGQ